MNMKLTKNSFDFFLPGWDLNLHLFPEVTAADNFNDIDGPRDGPSVSCKCKMKMKTEIVSDHQYHFVIANAFLNANAILHFNFHFFVGPLVSFCKCKCIFQMKFNKFIVVFLLRHPTSKTGYNSRTLINVFRQQTF